MAKFYTKQTNKSNDVYIGSQNDIMSQIYKPKKIESHRVATIMSRHLAENVFDENSRSYRMFHCGEYMRLDTPFKISTGETFFNRTRVTAANFCRDRFCPMCQYRLSRKVGLNLAKVIKVLHDTNYHFVFVTLTMPNVKSDDLSDAIKIMFNAWYKFYHLKSVQVAFKGYFKSLEVTYNDNTQTYHPHLHILVAVQKSYFSGHSYLSRDTITEFWRNSLNKCIDKYGNENIIALKRDDFYSCDIRRVQDNEQQFTNACYELSKYISKSNDINDITFESFFKSLSGVHTYSYIGVFKVVFNALKLNEQIIDDEIDNFDIGHIINHYTFDYDDMIYALRKGEK